MISAAAPRTTLSAAAPKAANAPPPGLPGEHFAAALGFLVLGGLGLVFVAPELAAGAFFVPHVLATVHLFTLGWIMLSIFGALCQFLPVAVGRSLRWERLAHVSFGFQVLGTAALVTSLFASDRTLLLVAGSSLGTAFLLFAINLASTLKQATERSVTWWALAGSVVFLLATPAYGIALALNLHSNVLGAVDRFALVARHAHVAIVGVILLVAVGVAHRLIPMFLLSHGATEKPARWSVALLFSSALLLAIPVGGHTTALIAGVLAALGVVAFLAQAVAFYLGAKRRSLDPGMKLAAAGLLGILAALVAAPFALSRGVADPRPLTGYHLLLLGGISMFVAGHYYKIVPFLVWYHRFGPLVGKRPVPKVADLYSVSLAHLNGALLVAGWLGLVLATYFGLADVARGAAVLFAAGAVLELFVIARVAQRRPA